MFEIIKAGGWVMWPIIACSVVALAIIGERFWALQSKKILPPELIPLAWKIARQGYMDQHQIQQLRQHSPLGSVLAAGLANYRHGREVMKECLEEAGRRVVHDMERYLNTLGTIAAIAPYLGLLGSVLGMIEVFANFSSQHGIGDPARLAGGISQILVTTAAGLIIAIPSLMFHRYFHGLIDTLALRMEEEALGFIEKLYGERDLNEDEEEYP